MDIYPSTRALPYVYICTHKESGQFYIGYRSANVKLNKPSHIDLPEYKTSSKIVRSSFENFTWCVVAEFYDKDSAYDFEQQLIHTYWNDPLLLNKTCYHQKSRFRCPTGVPCREETKRKIGAANRIRLTGIRRTDEFKNKISVANQGKTVSQDTKDKLSKIVSENHKKNPRIWSNESRQKLSATNKGRKISDEQKKKISEAKRLRDILRPMSEETRRKISESLKGRKNSD
jgi:hypothetical protein